jgi:membrane protease YdiL (CAAX protease family)
MASTSGEQTSGTPSATGFGQSLRSGGATYRWYHPDTPWAPFQALGITVVVLITCLVGLLVAFVVAGYYVQLDFASVKQARGGVDALGTTTRDLLAETSSFAMLVGQAVGVAMTLFFAGLMGGRPSRVLALGPPATGIWLTIGLVVGFVAFALGIGALVQLIWPKVTNDDMKSVIEMIHSPAWLMLFLAVVVGAPISEEMLFRGYLFSALASSWPRFLGGTLISSALWSVLHASYSWQGVTTIFALGLALSFVLWRTGSIWVTMSCHGLYNLAAFLGAMVQPVGS